VITAVIAASTAGLGAGVAAVPNLTARIKTAVSGRAQASDRLMADLAATQTSLAAWLAATTRSLALAITIGAAVGAVAATGGLPPITVVACVGFGVWFGLLVPRARLSRRAEQARAALNRLSVDLAELMSLALAGNLGLEAAFALAIDTLPGVERIAAVTAAPTPWEALEAFGENTRAECLADLGRMLQVSAEQRARVRDTLLGWAATVRQAALADAETRASTATEAMSAPLVLTAMSLFLFLCIPALVNVFGGISNLHLP
jgi:hypothetical protein